MVVVYMTHTYIVSTVFLFLSVTESYRLNHANGLKYRHYSNKLVHNHRSRVERSFLSATTNVLGLDTEARTSPATEAGTEAETKAGIETGTEGGTFVESFELQNWGLFDQSVLTLGSKPVFAVITGETGSGKSVLISAIQYLYSSSGDYFVVECVFICAFCVHM